MIYASCKNCRTSITQCPTFIESKDIWRCHNHKPRGLYNLYFLLQKYYLDNIEKHEIDVRFKIIYLMNKHHDKYCWSDLVSWALRYRTWEDVNYKGRCMDHGERPYCGNCWTKSRKELEKTR